MANTLIYGDGSKVDPAFKLTVARVCRSEAAKFAREQRRTEAVAKIAAAERLERQAAEESVEDVLEHGVWETHQIREPA